MPEGMLNVTLFSLKTAKNAISCPSDLTCKHFIGGAHVKRDQAEMITGNTEIETNEGPSFTTYSNNTSSWAAGVLFQRGTDGNCNLEFVLLFITLLLCSTGHHFVTKE